VLFGGLAVQIGDERRLADRLLALDDVVVFAIRHQQHQAHPALVARRVGAQRDEPCTRPADVGEGRVRRATVVDADRGGAVLRDHHRSRQEQRDQERRAERRQQGQHQAPHAQPSSTAQAVASQ
jgi:hypothetical protein